MRVPPIKKSVIMETYLVGGAVRDALLGLEVSDRDFVVVGASPQGLLSQGFIPVGSDFPVFLHPTTKAEYALARTERKTGAGYKGFVFHADEQVTLLEDLARRDLTINAMAQDERTGEIIDPFGGQADLAAGILRHVSPAFSEDPVRILRIARFAARFGFSIAPETLALMKKMVIKGEVSALVPERVWQELSRGLMEKKPSIMIETLKACGALAVILPEVHALFGVPQHPEYHPEIDTGVHICMAIDYAASQHHPLPVRFAALTHDLGKGCTDVGIWPRHPNHDKRGIVPLTVLCHRLRVPLVCRELAEIVVLNHTNMHKSLQMRPYALLELLQKLDAFRRPERFELALQACISDKRGRLNQAQAQYPQADHLRRALAIMKAVDAGQIALTFAQDPRKIPYAITQARCTALLESDLFSACSRTLQYDALEESESCSECD
jgi:tRNA nucleotidyltransferase (CCA-adding enzyme)